MSTDDPGHGPCRTQAVTAALEAVGMHRCSQQPGLLYCLCPEGNCDIQNRRAAAARLTETIKTGPRRRA